MDEKIARTIRNLADWQALRTFEKNARAKNALSGDLQAALPAQAYLAWKALMSTEERAVKSWAMSFQEFETEAATEGAGSESSGRNPPWTRDELILALDFYVRCEGTPPDPNEFAEI